MTIEDTTIAFNTAGSYGGGVFADMLAIDLTRIIVVDNGPDDVHSGFGGVITTNSLVGGGDPGFGTFDYHGGTTRTLSLTSAATTAIDQGGSSANTSDQRGYTKNGDRDIGAFEFNGDAPNAAPAWSTSTLTDATRGSAYSLVVTATDADSGDTLAVTGSGLPAFLTLTDNGDRTATLTGTPDFSDAGDHTFSLTVGDGSLSSMQSFTLTVNDPNISPTITTATLPGVLSGIVYSQTVTATDPNLSDTLAFTAINLPSFLTLSDDGHGTATLTGTPTNGDAGDHTFTLKVNDGTAEVTQVYSVEVTLPNQVPTFLTTAMADSRLGINYKQTITMSDTDGDLLSITALSLPSFLTLSDHGDGTAMLAGMPLWTDHGTHSVQVQVDDGTVQATQTFIFEIIDSPIATVQNHTLFVNGTPADDNIRVWQRNGQSIRVMRGSEIRNFDLAGINDIWISGDAGNDTVLLNAKSLPAHIFAGDGNDFVFGGNGDDRIDGGAGDDTLFGNAGDDYLYGMAGNDQIDTGTGRNYAWGGAGNDVLVGGNSADRLRGDAGNDTIYVRGGKDILDGGDDDDIAFFVDGDVVTLVETLI